MSTVLGLPADSRQAFDIINAGIKALAHQHGFLLADLEALFHGHGIASPDPWYELHIEPNYAGATAIALHWLQLYRSARP